MIAGSVAMGDYVAGVSDLDLVAIVNSPIDQVRRTELAGMHADLDRGVAALADLGCVYVDEGFAADPIVRHPTWIHGALPHRVLSGITRAELVRHGSAVFGRAPTKVLASMTHVEVRDAACSAVCGLGSGLPATSHVVGPGHRRLGSDGHGRGGTRCGRVGC